MIEKILQLHGTAAYALLFLLPALEASAFVGFLFPGEIAVLLGGVLAFQGRINLGWAIGFAIAGAIIGDSVGYTVGKRVGPRLLDGPLRRLVPPERRQKATDFIRAHGGKAVFFGRFTAALRVLVPGFAGMADMPYRTFLLYNVLGGVVWATTFTLIGFVAGEGYRKAEHFIGRASLVVFGLAVSAGIIVFIARRVSKNQEGISAWWERLMSRPLVGRFRTPFEFLLKRFQPGRALGLALTAGVLAVGVLGVAFGVLLRDVLRGQELRHSDRPLLDILIRNSTGGLTRAMRDLTHLGDVTWVALIAVIVALALAARRWWPQVFLVLLAPAGATIIERAVKEALRIPSPSVHALIPVANG